MFAIQKMADVALLQANKIPLLLLTAAFVLYILTTIVLTVRAVQHDKAFTAQPDMTGETKEEKPC